MLKRVNNKRGIKMDLKTDKDLKSLKECLEWCKSNGYVYADNALNSVSFLLNQTYMFKSNIWSGGEYFTIE
jgi:hypothetical protein